MNLIKVLSDVLEVHDKFEYLMNELDSGKPVCYYSHFKAQKIILPSGTKCLMISKFDYCKLDFVRFCEIIKSDNHLSWWSIDISGIIRIKSGQKANYINAVHNYYNRIDQNLTKDQFFNIQLEYDIPYTYEELMQVLEMSKLIKADVWVYNE